MKSPRVDIFRPLAAATRGCRPSSDSATSIFRRNGVNNQSQQCGINNPQTSTSNEEEDESFVISVPPGAWPPHQNINTFGSDASSAQHKKLDISAPLSSCESSPDASRKSVRSKSRSPFKKSKSKAANAATVSPPSYYKIELVDQNGATGGGGGAEDTKNSTNKNMVQLTSGEDSSIILTADHNEQLQLAQSNLSASGRVRHPGEKQNIIRASPVVELESIEHEVEGAPSHHSHHIVTSSDQRWTISDNGNIIAVPPSPSSVSMSHFQHKTKTGGDKPNTNQEDFSIPPLLVKACSSNSSSSEDSFISQENQADFEKVVGTKGSGGSSQLESPPRMNRSLLSQSLFEESFSSKGGTDDDSEPKSGKSSSNSQKMDPKSCAAATYARSRSRSNSPSNSQNRGGCGARPLDFLSQILDVFSLNGACCHQPSSVRCGGSDGGAAAY